MGSRVGLDHHIWRDERPVELESGVSANKFPAHWQVRGMSLLFTGRLAANLGSLDLDSRLREGISGLSNAVLVDYQYLDWVSSWCGV